RRTRRAARGRRAVRAAHLATRVRGRRPELKPIRDDLLGAHVSTLGGVGTAPARALAIGATAIQVFTKTPNQWREPVLAAPDDVGVLIEGTAGAGTALGSTFEELKALRDAMPAAVRARVGFCLDTAHLHAAGYDVAGAIDTVWDQFDRTVGLPLLKCLHLN